VILAEYATEVFRVQPHRHVGRADQVTEQDGEVAPLRGAGKLCDGGKGRGWTSPGRGLQRRAAATAKARTRVTDEPAKITNPR
jgi:hypothetical protein